MRRVVLSVVLIAVIVLAIPAAYAADWNYGFRLGTGPWTKCGTMASASDLLDGNDKTFGDAWVPEATIVGIGSRLGNSFLQEDYRAPLLPGQSKTWQVNVEYVHIGMYPPPTSVTVNWSPQTPVPSNMRMTLRLMNAPMSYAGPTFWDLTMQPIGSVTLPWSGGLPPFPTTYYNFEYKVIAAVPEPSGVFTVLSGLMGTLAVLRRRK